MIVHEAATTVVDLYEALVRWLIVAGVAGVIVGWAAVASFAPGWRALGNRLSRPVAASDASKAPREPQSPHSAPEKPSRPTPSWARTDHHRWDQAA